MKKKYLNLEFCHDLSAPNMKNSNAPRTNLTEIVWLFVKTKAQSWSGFMVEWKFCVLFSHFSLSELLKGEHGDFFASRPSNRTCYFSVFFSGNHRILQGVLPLLKRWVVFHGLHLRQWHPLTRLADEFPLRYWTCGGHPAMVRVVKRHGFLHGRCFMFITVVFGMFHVCNLGYL